MSGNQRWLRVLTAVVWAATVALVWLTVQTWRRGPPTAADAQAATHAVAEPPRPGALVRPVAPVDPARPVAPIRQAADSPARPVRYRPATFLRYSEGVPSTNPADDERSPIFARIVAVTDATSEQRAALAAAWRAHEDGRRVLLAEARPPSIGLPILDRAGLARLDRALEDALQDNLRPEQQDRLALELPPPSDDPEPEEPPVLDPPQP